MNILLISFNSQIFQIPRSILLLKYFEKRRVFNIKFLCESEVTSALGPIFMWKTWLSGAFLLSFALIILSYNNKYLSYVKSIYCVL